MSCLALSLEAKISVSGHPIYRKKCGNVGWKTKSYFWNTMFHNTEKTETRHGNAPQIIFVARTTTPKSLKEAGFVYLLHKLVFIVSRVDWCARIRLNVRVSLLEKESATGSTLLLLRELFKPLLGRTRSRARCWADIRLAHRPKPSGHAVQTVSNVWFLS